MSVISLQSRQEVEAGLLDEWRLERWPELLTDDAIYQVPPPTRAKATLETRCLLSPDDTVRIRSRVKQLVGNSAWPEIPIYPLAA